MTDKAHQPDGDWRVAYLERKLARLRKNPVGNKWSIISTQNALDYLLHGDQAEWCKKAGWHDALPRETS